MSCGKTKLVKNWDHPRTIRRIKQSRYEKNEDSVKTHWKNVIKDMENVYKDDKFWESSKDTVRDLVGPAIFDRLIKIFNLPPERSSYVPRSEADSFISSTDFYKMCNESLPVEPVNISTAAVETQSEFSVAQEESFSAEPSTSVLSAWTDTESDVTSDSKKVMSKSVVFSRTNLSKTTFRSRSSMKRLSRLLSVGTDAQAYTDDDIEVNVGTLKNEKQSQIRNPHFEMLYCNESETDMIKWNSKYKKKGFEISASEEYNKFAEILTKKIAKEFFDFWVALGSSEFKSEIKRPEDIEDLFQLWFNEHASRGLVLHSKILPCVLKSIAEYVGEPDLACPNVLKKYIADDIYAETSPAHTRAFDSSLPNNLKHMPPRNNTTELWKSAEIPEDLRTMACIWQDIKHLTSTKAFQTWLKAHPHLPMPICLRDEPISEEKKALFVVPSDFVMTATERSSSAELNLPVSKISFELNAVLSKLMNE